LFFCFSSIFSSDFSKLVPQDVAGNCRIAFDTAENLGIPRVIEPRDMNLLAVPDKLAVMTYLYQLRAHFTGNQLEIERIGDTTDDSSYVIGNYKSDNLSTELLDLNEVKLHLQSQNSFDEDYLKNNDKSPTQKKDVKNIFLSGSKNFLGKVLTPAKDKAPMAGSIGVPALKKVENTANNMNNRDDSAKDKPLLMSRRELTDPFGSDEEDENTNLRELKSNENTTVQDDLNGPTAVALDTETTNVSKPLFNKIELLYITAAKSQNSNTNITFYGGQICAGVEIRIKNEPGCVVWMF
jgi:hypothetical protein